MSSRKQIIQTVSNTEPVGAALGDEWFQPTTNKLFKRMVYNGVVGWNEISLAVNGATTIVGGATGSIPYQSAAGTTNFISIGSNGQVLTSNGTTATWAAAPGATTVNTQAQTASASYFLTFVDSNNAASTAENVFTTSSFVINPSNGNVGIGTAAPTVTLDITGSQSWMRTYGVSGGFAQRFVHYRGTVASPTIVTTGTTLGTLDWLGYDGAGLWAGAAINSIVEAGVGTNSMPAALIFQTNPGTTFSSERMRITSTGTVRILSTAIANSTNSGALQVEGGVGIGGNLYVGGTINGTFAGVVTSATTVSVVQRTTSADHFLTFVDSNNATATAENIYTTSSFTINPGTGGITARTGALFTATSTPNSDLFTISNLGFAPSNVGLSGLRVYYTGTNGGSDESAAIRASTVPGSGVGQIGSVLRIAPGAPASNVTFNGVKVDSTTTAFAGTSNAIWVGVGHNNILNYNGTTVINGSGQIPAAQILGAISSATIANTIPVVQRTTSADHFLTFVDSNNATATAENIYTTSSFTINPGTGRMIVRTGAAGALFTATSALTSDLFTISNLGFPPQNVGLNGLRVDYTGTTGGGESATIIASTVPGSSVGQIGSVLRIAPGAPASNVTFNGVKVDSTTTAFAGTSNAIWVGTGHNNILNYNGTTVINGLGQIPVARLSGTIPIASGGTGATTAPAAFAALTGFTATATAAGTTVLTNASSFYQLFTGSTTQTITLPNTNTLTTGWSFHIVNNSTGNLTLQTSTAAALGIVLPGTTVMATVVSTAGNTAAAWEFGYTDFSTTTGTGAVVLATSPALVTPTLGTASATRIINAAGTLGAPSYTFTGDTATGMWSPATNVIAFSENGNETMRIDDVGNVGIGINAPVAKIHVIGTARITGITSVTNVTQATSTATGAFQVAGGAGIGGNLFVGGAITATNIFASSLSSRGYGSATGIDMYYYRGTVASPTIVQAGDTLGSMTFYGWDGDQNTLGAFIASTVEAGVANNDMPADLQFWTNPGSTLPSERMRITGTGNVGIGVASPLQRLHIRTTTTSTDGLILDTASGANPWIRIIPSATQGSYNNLTNPNDALITYSAGTVNSGGLTIAPWNGAGGAGVGLRMDNTGTVQITGVNASSTITGALQVVGGAGIGGNLFVGGAITATNIFIGPWAVSTSTGGDGSTVNTQAQPANNNYFLTFVDSNNASATAENVFTTSSFFVNPSNGTVSVGGDIYSNLAVVTGNNTNGWGRIVNASSATYFQSGSLNSGAAAAQPFIFTNMYGGSERMRITAAGDVGIGTASVTAKLTVAGTVNFSGALTSGDLADAVGYKGLPQNSTASAYTLALSDIGKHISITTGGVVIPANGSVPFPVGSSIVIYNNSASAQNISITTDTLRLAGTATTGIRSLAQRGLATCIKVASTEWVVTGNVT